MLCKEIMNKNLITCSLSTKVFEIAKIMKEKDIGFIPIVFNDKKTISGVITDRDIITRIIANEKSINMEVSAFISRNYVSVFEDDDVTIALSKMADFQIKRILVVDKDYYLKGIITLKDISLHKYTNSYLNDLLKEISKEKVSEKVITKAVNEIIVVGTADYNINSAKITGEFAGFMCKEDQTIEHDGVKFCDDFQELSGFNAIRINDSVNYVIRIDDASVTPFKITQGEVLYKGTYNGTTYYFDSRAGGGEDKPLTEELCNQYKLNCGEW